MERKVGFIAKERKMDYLSATIISHHIWVGTIKTPTLLYEGKNKLLFFSREVALLFWTI